MARLALSEQEIRESTPEDLADSLNISLESATEIWRAANGFREDEIVVEERKPSPPSR